MDTIIVVLLVLILIVTIIILVVGLLTGSVVVQVLEELRHERSLPKPPGTTEIPWYSHKI